MCDPLVEDCPPEEPTGPSFEDMEKPSEELFTSSQIREANLKIMGAALTATIYFAWSALRYQGSVSRKALDTSIESVIDTGNKLKTGTTIRNYAGLVIYGSAFVGQLLNTLGMFGEINAQIWKYGVSMGMPAVAAFYAIFAYLTVNKAYGLFTSTTASTKATALSTKLNASYEVAGFLGVMTLVKMTVAMHWPVWLYGMQKQMEDKPAEEN